MKKAESRKRNRPLKPYEIDVDVIDLDMWVDHMTLEYFEEEFLDELEALFESDRGKELVFVPDGTMFDDNDDMGEDSYIKFILDDNGWGDEFE